MKLLPIICFLVAFISYGFSQTKSRIIIDTDGAIDDLRAICMLLSINDYEICAITTCDGTLSPEKSFQKVNALIKSINNNSIPVGLGRKVKTPPPPWRNSSEKVNWGTEENIDFRIVKSATEVLFKELLSTSSSVTIICLGTFTNIFDLLKKHPDIKSKIKKILWYNSSVEPLSGSNYEQDKEAADFVLNSGLQVDVISNLRANNAIFDMAILDSIRNQKSIWSDIVWKAHSDSLSLNLVKVNHLGIWDDLLPVYLVYPNIFEMKELKKNPLVSINTEYNVKAAREKIVGIFGGKYSLEKNITFEFFPANEEFYQFDVAEILKQTIARFGMEEWKACILTNEIHGHLGIYSVLGAKMGIFAREYFNAPIDRLIVQSLAGTKPPISCLNDGLQTSTGSTVGYGTFILLNGDNKASAIISYIGKKKKFSLKPEFNRQVEIDIQNGILAHGNLTDGYWKLIRKLAIKYWSEWDRNSIFIVEDVD